jgi:hypothetical protein
MGNAVTNVLEALERYVGPYVPSILDRVFPSENKREQEKQENVDWEALTVRLEALASRQIALATKIEQNARMVSLLTEDQNVIPLHAVAEA